MKLDVNVLKFLAKDDFRVLTAVEVGQKNHELVPLPLIENIAALRTGGAQRAARNLLRYKLLHHDSSKYDGYRLTPLGYDYLALKALVNRGAISSVGSQIGVGKESDVFEVRNDEGEVMALKLHRLGRTSFRAVKSKRDYLKHRSSFSWLYLSRLAAAREYSFMVALAAQGLPVPKPIDHNRHCVLMSLVDAVPLAQVQELHHAGDTFHELMALMERLTRLGLVHCDYNEFNLLVDTSDTVTLIDFPQMVSVSHENAQDLFDRDVDCVIKFFKTKIGYIPEQDEARLWKRPVFEELRQGLKGRLDIELQASGHPKLGKDGKPVRSGRSPLDPDLASDDTDSDVASQDESAHGSDEEAESTEGSQASSSSAPAYDDLAQCTEQPTAAPSEEASQPHARQHAGSGGAVPGESTGKQDQATAAALEEAGQPKARQHAGSDGAAHDEPVQSREQRAAAAAFEEPSQPKARQHAGSDGAAPWEPAGTQEHLTTAAASGRHSGAAGSQSHDDDSPGSQAAAEPQADHARDHIGGSSRSDFLASGRETGHIPQVEQQQARLKGLSLDSQAKEADDRLRS